MKRRSIVALGLIVVLAAALAAATSGATKKTTANSITVWLQVDAQTGWPDLVAAANQKFQSDHPGTTVNVQYQNWTDHLQKFDATLADGGGIATQVSGTWKGLLNSPKSIAGLTAYKNFFAATSRAPKTNDGTRPNP